MPGITVDEATGDTVLLLAPTPTGNMLGAGLGVAPEGVAGLGRMPISGVIVRGADAAGVIGAVTAG